MTDLPFSFSHLSIAGGVRAAAGRDPGKLAYRHGERTRTYAQLIERIDRVTTALRGDLGLREGDHGAIVAKNSIEYMELVIGAAQAGVALATVNPKLAPAEIKAICEDAGARVLFVDTDSEEALSDTGIDGLDRTIVIENDYDDWIARSRPDAPPVVEEWGTFTIPYTSGTTGKPKGVLVSHRSRILSMFAMASEYGCYAPDDRFLAIAPMCHGAGMIFSLTPVFFGGYAEIMDAFDPEQVMLRLKQERMTGFFGVPTHFNVLFSLEKAFLDANRPGHLKTVISNAAALPQAMKETLVDYLGPGILHETYGSTEAGIVLNLRPADQLRKQACVGQPIPSTLVSIRDDDGNECGAEEVGELFSRSPFLFNGYWNRPEETAEAYRDGWVTVGDMVRRDAEGYCYIVDRKKDLVISGGVNIYPREIEEVLIMHPQVKDVAVIGVPDDKWGESLKAFVVGDTADSESLEAFCAERISRMKTPRAFEFIDTIPRNATGKVLKTELRKRG
jgi:acyl-CoA synthetase (AMP-forming)/AMP-acid ligase II